MKRGFTLIEMLVVLGIIAVLIGASIGGYSKMTKTAERARVQEVVNNTATALAALFQQDGVWPAKLRTGAATDAKLDRDRAIVLAKRGFMSLTMNADKTALDGLDQFGVVTPWATAAIKRAGRGAALSTKVAGALATIDDHILHYALDLDGDGVIRGASVGGASIDVRASAIVWCCGKNGKITPYAGGKGDNIYSWTPGQTYQVK